MSQENVEVVRVFTKAFNAGDIDAVVACCDPKVEFHSTFAAVGGGVYHGHDGGGNRLKRIYGDVEVFERVISVAIPL